MRRSHKSEARDHRSERGYPVGFCVEVSCYWTGHGVRRNDRFLAWTHPEDNSQEPPEVRPEDQSERGIVKRKEFFRHDHFHLMTIAFDVSRVGLDLRQKHKYSLGYQKSGASHSGP